MVLGAMEHVLDNPVWHALIGPHRSYAMGRGLARHYPRDMAPFSAIVEASDAAYADLAVDLPPGAEARLFRPREEPLPCNWQQLDCFPMLQMIARGTPKQAPEMGTLLSVADSGAMADLVAIAKPGPFGPRTPLLGQYFGVRDGDRLLAMAGERMRLRGLRRIERDLRPSRGARTRLCHRPHPAVDAAGIRPRRDAVPPCAA